MTIYLWERLNARYITSGTWRESQLTEKTLLPPGPLDPTPTKTFGAVNDTHFSNRWLTKLFWYVQ